MTGSDRIVCRRLEDGDLESTVAMLRAAFGGWPGYDLEGVPAVEHLRWKLGGVPREPGQTVAVLGDRVVGSYLTIPRRLRLRGDTVLMVDSVDNAVHPDCRGRGLLRQMAASANGGGRQLSYHGAWGNYAVSEAVFHVWPRDADTVPDGVA
ncbi:MAG: GNAT family N-acetyltransferase, partial [Thermoanaerobaculia bacterium]|nr:GNAT family N-acetyltransferase [Thermoanaerobaculia bacterium]